MEIDNQQVVNNILSNENINMNNNNNQEEIEECQSNNNNNTLVVVSDQSQENTTSIPEKIKIIQAAEMDDLDNECPICFEQFTSNNPFIFTTCHHRFHIQCIIQWQERSNCCPLCWTVFALDGEEIPNHVRLPASPYSTASSGSSMHVEDLDLAVLSGQLAEILGLSSQTITTTTPTTTSSRNHRLQSAQSRRRAQNQQLQQTPTRPTAHSAPDARSRLQFSSENENREELPRTRARSASRISNFFGKFRSLMRRLSGQSNHHNQSRRAHNESQTQPTSNPQPEVTPENNNHPYRNRRSRRQNRSQIQSQSQSQTQGHSIRQQSSHFSRSSSPTRSAAFSPSSVSSYSPSRSPVSSYISLPMSPPLSPICPQLSPISPPLSPTNTTLTAVLENLSASTSWNERLAIEAGTSEAASTIR